MKIKTLQRLACIALLFISPGCVLYHVWEGLEQFQSEKSSPVSAKYAHVSDSAPESLKPYYDPELTRALNER